MLYILYAASSILSPGYSVTGTIDGKFDSGYLVTVNLGADQLKGVGDYKILQIYLIGNFTNLSQFYIAEFHACIL